MFRVNNLNYSQKDEVQKINFALLPIILHPIGVGVVSHKSKAKTTVCLPGFALFLFPSSTQMLAIIFSC